MHRFLVCLLFYKVEGQLRIGTSAAEDPLRPHPPCTYMCTPAHGGEPHFPPTGCTSIVVHPVSPFATVSQPPLLSARAPPSFFLGWFGLSFGGSLAVAEAFICSAHPPFAHAHVRGPFRKSAAVWMLRRVCSGPLFSGGWEFTSYDLQLDCRGNKLVAHAHPPSALSSASAPMRVGSASRQTPPLQRMFSRDRCGCMIWGFPRAHSDLVRPIASFAPWYTPPRHPPHARTHAQHLPADPAAWMTGMLLMLVASQVAAASDTSPPTLAMAENRWTDEGNPPFILILLSLFRTVRTHNARQSPHV